MVPLLRRRSRGLPIVEIEEPAEPIAAFNPTQPGTSALGLVDQTIAKSLMVPLQMIVLGVLGNGSPKMRLAAE